MYAVIHSDSRLEVSRHDTCAKANKAMETYEAIDREMGEENEYEVIPVEDD